MEEPKRFGPWIVRSLISGRTGQAKVWEVHREAADAEKWELQVRQAFELLTSSQPGAKIQEGLQKLRQVIAAVAADIGARTYALKHIKRTEADAAARWKTEIELLRRVHDPALLPLLDVNEDERWFVTELFPHTLETAILQGPFDSEEAIRLLRPIVRVLATFHHENVIHRDVKPANIFVRENRSLVLGDFGIAFDLADENEARVTREHERVGSRDWMPPWSNFGRLENVDFAFDVHSMGKVLWAMVTGNLRLPSRHDYDPSFLPTGRTLGTKWATRIIQKSVGERPQDCLHSASDLLREFDAAVASFDTGRHPFLLAVPRTCIVCGHHTFVRLDDGQVPAGANSISDRVITELCEMCGNIQQYLWKGKKPPPAYT